MHILEILILVAIAIVIYIVIRRLPDTRAGESGVHGAGRGFSYTSGSDVLKGMVGRAIGIIKSPIDRVMNRRKGKKQQILTHDEELKQQLKKPEDREFWIEHDAIEQRNVKPDMIAKTYFEDAEAAFKIKDYRKAEALFLEVARGNPKNVKVFNRLGAIYLEQKNYEDAIEAFSTALKYDEKVCARYYNLALAYIGQGGYEEAVKNLKAAIELSPTNEKYKQVLEQIEKKC